MKLLSRYHSWLFGYDPNLPVVRQDLHRIGWDLTNRRAWVLQFKMCLYLLPFFLLALLVIQIVGSLARPNTTIVITFIVLAITWPVWLLVTLKRVWGPHYRRELQRRGYDICIECGYWLRGLGAESQKCPECGAERIALKSETGR